MTFRREDLYRCLLDAFANDAAITDPVHTRHSPAPSMGARLWHTFELESISLRETASGDYIGEGTVRILNHVRATTGSTGLSDLSEPHQMTDKVATALEGEHVQILNNVDGDGTTLTGIAYFQKIQTDDLGEPLDGVHTVISTCPFFLSAP